MPLDSLRELEAAREAYRNAVASGNDDRIKAAAIWLVQSELRHDRALGVPVVSTRAQRVLPYFLVFALIAAIGIAAIGIHRSSDTADQVRPIIESPCQINPAGEACAAIRLETAKREPLAVPCTSFSRIVRPREVYEKFTRCPDLQGGESRFGRDVTREEGQGNAPRTSPSADSPSAAPSDPGAAGPGNGSDGGDGDTAPPSPQPPEPPPTDPDPDPPAPPEPEPPPPAEPEPNGLGAVTQGAGQVIEGTGEIICGSARVLCR